MGKKRSTAKVFHLALKLEKKMIESVFGDSVTVSSNYTFFAPFKKYFPPLISPKSWSLRKQILQEIEDDYFTFKKKSIFRHRAAQSGFFESIHFVFDEKKVLQEYGFETTKDELDIILQKWVQQWLIQKIVSLFGVFSVMLVIELVLF